MDAAEQVGGRNGVALRYDIACRSGQTSTPPGWPEPSILGPRTATGLGLGRLLRTVELAFTGQEGPAAGAAGARIALGAVLLFRLRCRSALRGR